MNRFSLGILLTGFACLAAAETETEQKTRVQEETFVRECEVGVGLGVITLVEQKRIPIQDLVVTKNTIAAQCRQVTPAEFARILELSKWVSTRQVGAEFARLHFKLPESELLVYRARVMRVISERGQLTNQELERLLQNLEVDAKPNSLAESQQRELYVMKRFTQMCAHGFEAGIRALKAADVPAEQERAAHQAVCQDFYADATARSDFDAKYTEAVDRDVAACALGTLVVFQTRNAEMTREVVATAAVTCATIIASASREDIEKGTR